ncbi:uncharacterized protein TNCV_1417081 [Trichonephila clavipes]|nr:uncharacterized protein TNCV_1417081 [Trichonephila clavipes]
MTNSSCFLSWSSLAIRCFLVFPFGTHIHDNDSDTNNRNRIYPQQEQLCTDSDSPLPAPPPPPSELGGEERKRKVESPNRIRTEGGSGCATLSTCTRVSKRCRYTPRTDPAIESDERLCCKLSSPAWPKRIGHCAQTPNETHQEQLPEYLLNLDAKQIELQTLNKEVQDLLSDKELFEAEIEGSLEYEENINEVRYKIKCKINKIHLSQPVVNSKGANESNVRTNNFAFSLNLPKLRIPNFSGDSSTYLEFINSFTNAIDANESLSNVDKFIYLKSFLSGEASKIVSGFALTEDNYKSCLNLLKDRYGRQDHLISCYMNKLLEIEPVKSFNLKGLRKLHDESEINIRNLDFIYMGIASGNYGHLLIPIMLNQLPHDLVEEFHRQKDSKDIGDGNSDRSITLLSDSEEARTVYSIFCTGVENDLREIDVFWLGRMKRMLKRGFVISKSRVAPIKKITLPRLKLMGAVIAARLVKHLKRIFKTERHLKGPLAAEELSNAEIFWVKVTQNDFYTSEITCLKNNKALQKDSKLLYLNPFLDDNGALRVTGRLGKITHLSANEKHPIIHPLPKLVVQVREKYWILKARQTIKSLLKKCITCKRFYSNPGSQVIAPLPDVRVTESPPFAVVGTDFAEPLFVKDSDAKQYILLITCAVTRSIHLELVGSMTTETHFCLPFYVLLLDAVCVPWEFQIMPVLLNVLNWSFNKCGKC